MPSPLLRAKPQPRHLATKQHETQQTYSVSTVSYRLDWSAYTRFQTDTYSPILLSSLPLSHNIPPTADA